MLKFQFLPIYIKNRIYDKENVRIEIIEVPCQNPEEEEYRFRIKSRHEDEIIIHRDIAIEHHQPRETHPHGVEHVQFKLHSESLGKIRITLDIKNDTEYKKCILGFLYILRNLIKNLEKFSSNISNEVLNLELFDKLENNYYFLRKKIDSSLIESKIDMETNAGIKVLNKTQVKEIKDNEALLPFFENIK